MDILKKESFLKNLYLLIYGIIFLGSLATSSASTNSRVILIERPSSVNHFTINASMIDDMFNKILRAYTQKRNVKKAWAKIGITPQDIVGIKITTQGGKVMSTHRPLINAVIKSLHRAGVPFKNIIIWDRQQSAMHQVGYKNGSSFYGNPRVLATLPDLGFDTQQKIMNEVAGKLIWGDLEFSGDKKTQTLLEEISNLSYLTKIISQKTTKLINIPVLSSDPIYGVRGCLASLALDSIDNWRRFYAPHSMPSGISHILASEKIRKKTVLHILDALIIQYSGGPHFLPEFTKEAGAIYLSNDPVSIDSLALQRVLSYRKNRNITPSSPLENHIKAASFFGLGHANRKQINLIKIH